MDGRDFEHLVAHLKTLPSGEAESLVKVIAIQHLEDKAWWETEKAQKLAERLHRAETRVEAIRTAYQRAESRQAAAWEKVYAKHGDKDRYLAERLAMSMTLAPSRPHADG